MRNDICINCGHSDEDHDYSGPEQSYGCWSGSDHGNRCGCQNYEEIES